MHTEVHVHGDIPLRRGVNPADLEVALRPWLDYVDVDSLAEATSAREDEPGISLDVRRRVLQICWTGYVGRNFSRAVETALGQLSQYAEETAEIEITYYHEDGRNEYASAYVGPSVEAIEAAKRRRMVEDVAAVLGRQFTDAEVREVTGLIQRLYDQRAGASGDSTESVTLSAPIRRGSKHLH